MVTNVADMLQGISSMNLLLVDDHTLLRDGLRSLLSNLSQSLIIHEAASLEDAIKQCETTTFQMVLLDLGLSTSRGLDTLITFRNAVPAVAVIVLSGDQDSRLIRAAIDCGAVGFVPKSHSSDLMIAALRVVLSGGIYLPPHVIDADERGIDADSQSAADNAFARLTTRQQEVAKHLLQGSPNKVIARELGLSEGTVKAHVSAIFQIIGARNRVEAVMLAARSQIKLI
jgi:DNA-binding NarL/FixJ family response regulator